MIKYSQMFLLLAFCLLSCNTSKPIGNQSLTNVKSNEFSQISIDIFGQVYTLNGNELTKLAPDLDTLFLFTFPSVDQINSIDLLNPNEIVAFSEGAQIIYILDNTLGLVSSINLNETELGLVVGICRTRDDLINVVSRDQKTIFRINGQGKINSSSDVLWNVDLSEIDDLVQINNYIALRSNKDNTVWLYDEFGTLYTQILDVETDFKLQSYNGLLCYLNKDNQVVFKNLERLIDNDQFKTLTINQSEIKSLYLYEDYIYMQMKNGKIRKESIQS